MKTFIVDNYSVLIFLLKYIICLVLLYYTVKAKKEKTLLSSIVLTFFVFSFIIVCNFLISLTGLFPNETPFYDNNFIDFLSIVFIVNFFYKAKKE
jgi:hypothetical protein